MSLLLRNAGAINILHTGKAKFSTVNICCLSKAMIWQIFIVLPKKKKKGAKNKMAAASGAVKKCRVTGLIFPPSLFACSPVITALKIRPLVSADR